MLLPCAGCPSSPRLVFSAPVSSAAAAPLAAAAVLPTVGAAKLALDRVSGQSPLVPTLLLTLGFFRI